MQGRLLGARRVTSIFLSVFALGCGAGDADTGARGDGANSAGAAGGAGFSGAGGNSGAGQAGMVGIAGGGGARAGAGGTSGGGAGAAGSAGRSGSDAAGMSGSGAGGAAGGAGMRAGAGGSGVMSSGCGQAAPQTGAFQAEITAFELERSYFISVPDDYDSTMPHRLVFGYHGSNYTGMRMRQYLDLEEPPLAERTIFVYPDGLPLTNQPNNVAWELGESGRDIAFFDTLFEHMTSTYCIDEDRVFVNGQSFGGLMTNAVGCLRGDVVRAIAVVAGSGPRGGTCREQVAVWITHGMDDMNVQFSSGESSRDHWVEANHCMDMTQPGMPPACLNYQGCDDGYPVIWCPHVNDAGHQHPSFGRAAVREFLNSF
jgi:poly(3-hydroxybutyrate) depolymerase